MRKLLIGFIVSLLLIIPACQAYHPPAGLPPWPAPQSAQDMVESTHRYPPPGQL